MKILLLVAFAIVCITPICNELNKAIKYDEDEEYYRILEKYRKDD